MALLSFVCSEFAWPLVSTPPDRKERTWLPIRAIACAEVSTTSVGDVVLVPPSGLRLSEPVIVRVYVPLGAPEVVMVSVVVKLCTMLLVVKTPVVPEGRPATLRVMFGTPVVEEPGTNVTLTEKAFEPVVSTRRLVGTVATVKS